MDASRRTELLYMARAGEPAPDNLTADESAYYQEQIEAVKFDAGLREQSGESAQTDIGLVQMGDASSEREDEEKYLHPKGWFKMRIMQFTFTEGATRRDNDYRYVLQSPCEDADGARYRDFRYRVYPMTTANKSNKTYLLHCHALGRDVGFSHFDPKGFRPQDIEGEYVMAEVAWFRGDDNRKRAYIAGTRYMPEVEQPK